ncbi:MAG: TldD/PmbA family protein [Chloroflexi bacterium]|nr:TldD/PmbA family protein [Chloroflexota bacterium]
MIELNELKRAVEQALAYLKTVPDLEEAEVFASSNGHLLTRINYTSHIPCNGLEEPKSTSNYGVGIRATFRAADSKVATGPSAVLRTGFGSEPSSLDLEGVRSALEKARKGAVHDPEFVSLPRPTGEKRSLFSYHDPKLMEVADEDLVKAGWQVINGSLDTFYTSERLLSLADSREGLRRLGLILGGDVTIIQERIAIGSTAMPAVQTDESTLMMSSLTSMVEAKDAKGSGWSTATSLREFGDQGGRSAAANAIGAIEGQRVRDGAYTVIFGPQPVTDLLNNLVLPSLNLGNFYASSTAFLGKLGKQVASPRLSIYDDGAARGLMGSKGITCEGLPTGRTELIKNGVLVGLLSNWYESQRILKDPRAREKLGVAPQGYATALVPRNGFRFTLGGGRHFSTTPGIAATNVVLEGADSSTREQLLRRVKDGLYIGRIWYTYPVNGLLAGDFTCTVTADSYIIKEGRLAAPLAPNAIRINDNISNILNNIVGITTERTGTLVWAADEVVYAPEIAVENVHATEIGSFLATEAM